MSYPFKDYLNREDVRMAIHIKDKKTPWMPCQEVFLEPHSPVYKSSRPDMFSEMTAILAHNPKVRVLLYSGDVDSVVNFPSTELFINRLSNYAPQLQDTVLTAQTWHYNNDIENVAGWWTQHMPGFDFVTVKGAGHFVPAYKPAQSMQMMANFLRNTAYDKGVHISVTPQPYINATTATTMNATSSTPMMTTHGPAPPPPCGGNGVVITLGVLFALTLLVAAILGFAYWRQRNGAYGGYIN